MLSDRQLGVFKARPDVSQVHRLIEHIEGMDAQIDTLHEEFSTLEKSDACSEAYAASCARERYQEFLEGFEAEVELYDGSWWLRIHRDADPASIEECVKAKEPA